MRLDDKLAAAHAEAAEERQRDRDERIAATAELSLPEVEYLEQFSRDLTIAELDSIEATFNGHRGSTTVEPDDARPVRDRLITHTQLANLPPRKWLVQGYLEADSLALAYGRRGQNKSFVAVDLLASIAAGQRWHGRAVEYGTVIYISAEGVGGLSKRFDSWRQHHPTADIGRLLILPEVLNLLSPAHVGEFAAAAADVKAKLIVVDTLARCMPGGDENSARDGGMVIEQLDSIRRKTGACVLAVHHSGKDTANGARGTSAFEAAVETVLEIGATDDVVTIKQTKQKNAPELPPLTLRAITVGQSLVLDDHHGDDGLPQAALETLLALAAVQVDGGVSASIWRLSSGKTEPTFYRHRKGLITSGLVSNVGTEKQPRYQVSEAGTLTLSKDSHGYQ